MKKIIILLFLMILCVGSLPAYADYAQTDNITVRLSGNMGQSAANSMITLEVYREGYSRDSLLGMSKDEYTDVLVCHDQGMTDDVGGYSFSFDIEGDTGTYVAYFSLEGSAPPSTESFFFVNMDDYKNAVIALNNAQNANEVFRQIRTNCTVLGFNMPEYDNVNQEQVCAMFYESFPETGLPENDRLGNLKLFNKALLVQRLNEKKTVNLLLESAAGLEQSDVSAWYQKDFLTQEFWTEFTGRLSGNGYTCYEDYQKDILRAYILSVVKEPNGYANIRTVLSEFESKTGISVTGVKDSSFQNVAGKIFSDYQSLAVEIANAGSESNPPQTGGGSSLAVVVKTSASPEPVTLQEKQLPKDIYDDLESASWARDAIVELTERGILNGKEPNKFCPDDSISREEFAKIIVQAFCADITGITLTFEDVPKDSWFYPYIAKGVKAGIINGLGENKFGAGENISRQDLCVMAYNAAIYSGYTLEQGNITFFEDDEKIADYARNPIYCLKNNRIVAGLDLYNFVPNETATRAQAAVIVYRLLKM